MASSAAGTSAGWSARMTLAGRRNTRRPPSPSQITNMSGLVPAGSAGFKPLEPKPLFGAFYILNRVSGTPSFVLPAAAIGAGQPLKGGLGHEQAYDLWKSLSFGLRASGTASGTHRAKKRRILSALQYRSAGGRAHPHHAGGRRLCKRRA